MKMTSLTPCISMLSLSIQSLPANFCQGPESVLCECGAGWQQDGKVWQIQNSQVSYLKCSIYFTLLKY